MEPVRVVALMGSYHERGLLAAALDEVVAGAREAGAEVAVIPLLRRRIEYCRNCRECCRTPGPHRGPCVIDDDVPAILDAVDGADALVLGAPVNFGDVNALVRTLLERTLGYVSWPEGAKAPKAREPKRRAAPRPAALVTSSAAPAVMTRLFARPLRSLRTFARVVGARPVGSLVAGLADTRGGTLDARTTAAARALGRKLVERARVAAAAAG